MKGHTVLYALAALLMASALAGCGSDSGASSASNVASLNAMSAQQLYEAAKKENGLSWYTSTPEGFLAKVKAAFEAKYPGVELNPLYLSGNTPTTRIQTEARANTYHADVVDGSGDAVYLAQAGLVDDSFKPFEAVKLPSGLTVPKGVFVDMLMTNVIMFNPKAVAAAGLKPPASFEDLTKPEWRGKFSIDPVTDDVLKDLQKSLGRASSLNLMKRLGDNKPVFVNSHSLAAGQVVQGSILAASSAYGEQAGPAKKADPDRADFVNPVPLPVNLGECAIIRHAPHPAAARLFINWELSKDGQNTLVKLGYTSLRSDVANDPAEWNPSKWPPAFEDVGISTEQQNKDLADYQAALGYQQ